MQVDEVIHLFNRQNCENNNATISGLDALVQFGLDDVSVLE